MKYAYLFIFFMIQPRIYRQKLKLTSLLINRTRMSQPDELSCWGPGQSLPVQYENHTAENEKTENSLLMERFFTSIQNTLDSKFSEIVVKMDGIGNRLESLETRQKSLEEEVRMTASSLVSSPALSTPGRRCRTPLALQVNTQNKF